MQQYRFFLQRNKFHCDNIDLLRNGINSIATISFVPPELAFCTNQCRRHEMYCNPEVLTPGNNVTRISFVPPELVSCTNQCRRHEIYCNPEVLTPGNNVTRISFVPPELASCTNQCRRHEIYCNPEVLTPGITEPEANTSSAVGTTDILDQAHSFLFSFLFSFLATE